MRDFLETWQTKRDGTKRGIVENQTAMHLSDTHDHVLVYAKSASTFQIGKVPRTEAQKKTFSNPDNDPRGDWKAENLSAGKFYAAGQFSIAGPKGHQFLPPKGRYWRCNEQQYETWLRDGRITFGRSGEGRPMLKKFLAEMQDGLTANTWWPHDEVGSNKEASIDLKRMFGDREDVFQNPKPEKLIQRVLTLASNPGDIVLDSFAGSGTTGAVAHKMGRRWIMVELPVKKIPKQVLCRCEWGRDDYSLRVENLPQKAGNAGVPQASEPEAGAPRRQGRGSGQQTLNFSDEG